MHQPPFKLAPTQPALGLHYRPPRDCCKPSGPVLGQPAAVEPEPAATRATAPLRRRKLWELESPMHCSVIGTCIGFAALRGLMARLSVLERATATDLEVHHAAVSLSSRDGAGARALQKALDRANEAALKRYAAARDDEALAALWQQSLRDGQVPGAYWALMTHGAASPALRQQAFGDVHMLSHHVGAANRADLQRFAQLENDNAELRSKLERQQLRMNAWAAERQAAAQAAGAAAAQGRPMDASTLSDDGELDDGSDELAQLRRQLATAQDRTALHTRRREEAELRLTQLGSETDRLAAELAQARAHAQALQRELDAMERQAAQPAAAETVPPRNPLAGKRVLYVGGRPSSLGAIQRYVEQSGGEFTRHGGGSECRSALLDAAILRADLAAFPVDCVDHESALRLKHLCKRAGIAWLALRTASLGSFVSSVTAELALKPAG